MPCNISSSPATFKRIHETVKGGQGKPISPLHVNGGNLMRIQLFWGVLSGVDKPPLRNSGS